ncbi:MAG: hypothetical protein FJY85_10240, partial [Deltaproteobacteria bacterium]|nr:hypothetical protein [Deltaproteobacteria bacterium]
MAFEGYVRTALRSLIVCLAVLAWSQLTWAEGRTVRGSAVETLNQAKAEKDLKRRIELLDTALQDLNLRGELLSSILVERGMALKAMKDCFRAVEDFSSAVAHSRKAMPARLESAECLIELD